jgi:Tfp pilus assembly protein PilX
MSLKLKFALIYRCSDKGFALPIAMGLGLIMLLIAGTMIMRSQGDRTIASAQKATNRGLSAAETGISRYQSLINNNRVIAKYDACIQRDATTGNCSDTGTVTSWANASAIPGIATCTGANGSSAVISATTGGWQDVDSSDSSKGQYKLRDYIYTPDSGIAANTPPGTGTLTVDGRVNQVGNGNTATEGVGTATTRLQVNIRVAKQSLSGLIPGLWVQNVAQNMGSNKVDGNILVSGCPPLPTGVSQSNLKDPTTQSVAANPNSTMPDTPTLPSSNLYSINGRTNAPGGVWGETFPRGTDQPQPDGSYTYLITSNLDNPSASNITIQSGKKVIFFVQGNINISGNTNINVGGDPSQMQIYGNTNQLQPNGTNTLKYGGCASGSSCPTTSVKAGGTGSISALIHAPDATGAIAGGAGGCDANSSPPKGFVGAVWIKKWDYSYASNTTNTLVCAKGDYGSFLATQDNAPPSISSITTWQRQEVQP